MDERDPLDQARAVAPAEPGTDHPGPGTPWPRPVPLVGDPTSAAERAADPAGWSFDAATVAALHAVLAARRDVRRFRADPVPAGLLAEVLAAGHEAPSVGHSQPWRFVVVREQATRDRAAAMADRERLRQAELMTEERRARLLDLQLDGIREAPVGIVVCCDRRAPAAGVLGRASFADADLWSCACAIENIWLAARAVGLGLGWVTLFPPEELAGLLGLPEGVETLGWLCVGWPDERPPSPGLERHGWSERLPLEEVVLYERWPAGGGPAAPVSHLAGPEPAAVVAGRDEGDHRLTVPGSLGVLDLAVNRVLALRPQPPASGVLVLAAGDHPVTRHGVSAFAPSVTAEILAASRAGVSLGAVTAREAGLSLEVVHALASRPAGDLVTADGLDPLDVEALLGAGSELGRRLGSAGLVCLGEVGIGNTTVAAALAAALAGMEPAEAVGLGAGADSAMVRRKREVVAAALERARAAHGTSLGRPEVALGALGGPEVALLAGVTLGAASERAPVVLDGFVTSVAALVAVRLEPAAQSALVAGQRSREAGHGRVLVELGLEPLLALRLRAGEGVGACLAAQLLLTAVRARLATATVG
ncbi:MAG TPA: 5,6-dimethylbenzimidazole synthase [Acidimicrobiales bacterium]|nr:5,6-dimethylbenzimidazole synthase [Acidimicrobiales bacterium]